MKKFIRKVAAVGAGAGMLLSTLGGALAADLSDLPEPMVDGGRYVSTAMVIGSAEDANARTTLKTYFDGKIDSGAAGLGDQIDTQEVKLQDNIASSTGLDTSYDNTDSMIFADDEVSIGGTSYDYHTELQISNTANDIDVETSLTSNNDKYELDPKLEIRKDALRYCYTFDESVNVSSAVGTSSTISNNNPFDLEFMGSTIRIDRVVDGDSFVAQVGESWTGHPGEIYSGNGISMEVISCDSSDCIVDFGGDQRTVSETNTVSEGEIDVYLQTAIAGVGTAAESMGTFIIGEDARLTINSGDKYTTYCSPSDGHGDPNCDKNNPDWVWNFDGLNTSTSGTSNDICVENDFEAQHFNKDPAGLGEYYGMPGGYLYVGVDDVNVPDTDYMTVEFYTETGNTEDLSNAGGYPISAIVLTITASESEGLVLDESGFTVEALSADTRTDEIYLYSNTTYAALNSTLVFYKDSYNQVQHAGNITNAATKVDWGYFNYKNTKNTDITMSLYGHMDDDDSLYLGFVPLNTSDANDNLWFRIQDADSAAGNWLGFGDTDNAESDEVVWGATLAPDTTAEAIENVLVGGKKYDLLTGYGMQVLDTDSAGDDDSFTLMVPGDQVKANVAIYEGGAAMASSADLLDATDSTAGYTNLILVGGPCVNSVTADFMELKYPACETASGIAQDKAVIEFVDMGSQTALIVAGWEKADTQRAATKVAAGEAAPIV